MNEDRIHEVLLAVGRMEGKIDGFLSTQADQDRRIDRQDARLDRQEVRLKTLEVWQGRIGGFLAIAGVVGTGLVSWLFKA